VLETQIRADLRAEIEAEVRAKLDRAERMRIDADPGPAAPCAPLGAADRLEVWLSANVDKTFFPTTAKARREYGVKAAPSAKEIKRPEPRRQEPTITVTHLEDLCRLELLRRHGARLGETFTLSELKTAWRQAALKTHPDRFVQADSRTQTRMAAIFREIAATVEELESLFNNRAHAA
jgi:hypothetical protein